MKTIKIILTAAIFITLASCTNPVEPKIYNHGVITWQNLEGGFWSIMPERVVPFNLPDKFKANGIQVKYIYEGMLNKTNSAIQWGKQVRLTEIKFWRIK